MEGGNGNGFFFKVCHQSREVLVKTQKMGFFEVMCKYGLLSVKTEKKEEKEIFIGSHGCFFIHLFPMLVGILVFGF